MPILGRRTGSNYDDVGIETDGSGGGGGGGGVKS